MGTGAYNASGDLQESVAAKYAFVDEGSVMKDFRVSDKDLVVIIESLRFRLQWYRERIKSERDEDKQSDLINDASFLDCLIKDFESKLGDS